MTHTPRPVRALAAVVLRNLLRDRSSLFFMLVLPVMIMVIIGSAFGGQQRLQVGVVDNDRSDQSRALVAALRGLEGVDIVTTSTDDLPRQLGRQRFAAGVVIPEGLSDTLAETGTGGGGSSDDSATGEIAEIAVVSAGTSTAAFGATTAVTESLNGIGIRVAAARFVADRHGGSVLELADRLSDRESPVSVTTTDIGRDVTAGQSKFALTAAQNLVLFVFINCLTTGPLVIRMRRNGLLERVMSTPASTPGIIGGLALGWFALAMVQSILLLVIGGVVFGVAWGDPLSVAVLTVVFAAVGCGAGLVIGVLGGNEDRVSAATPAIGMVLAALGGCMMPIEIFPPAMESVAHAIPHYWAMRAWDSLVFDGAGLGAIVGPLAVLIGFAVAFLGIASLGLRRQLSG